MGGKKGDSITSIIYYINKIQDTLHTIEMALNPFTLGLFLLRLFQVQWSSTTLQYLPVLNLLEAN